jgi:hypothetical protein
MGLGHLYLSERGFVPGSANAEGEGDFVSCEWTADHVFFPWLDYDMDDSVFCVLRVFGISVLLTVCHAYASG